MKCEIVKNILGVSNVLPPEDIKLPSSDSFKKLITMKA